MQAMQATKATKQSKQSTNASNAANNSKQVKQASKQANQAITASKQATQASNISWERNNQSKQKGPQGTQGASGMLKTPGMYLPSSEAWFNLRKGCPQKVLQEKDSVLPTSLTCPGSATHVTEASATHLASQGLQDQGAHRRALGPGREGGRALRGDENPGRQ